MKFDVPPMMVHNVPMAPFRSLFERSGGEVEWAQKDNIVTGRGEGKVIIIRIGSRKALINNQVVRMAMPAFIRHGRTMVPLGFLGQTMDVNIQWNRETGEIAITSKHVVAVRVPHRD